MSEEPKKPQLTTWPTRKLVPYDKNAKIHDDNQVQNLARSIQENGWTSPIVVDKNGVIIAGHGRRLAAISLGLEKVPVIVRDDLTDEQVRALRLADNRVAQTGYDTELLQEELAELAELEVDLSSMGFSDKELEFLSADLAEIDDSVFINDLESEVAEHESQTETTIENVTNRDVPIAKVLGFAKINANDERAVKRFMAQLEHETGKSGAEAFVEFINQLMQDDAA